MMCSMPTSGDDPGRGDVLSSLPATRPQRASAWRSASARSGRAAKPPDAGGGRAAARPPHAADRRAPRAGPRAAAGRQASARRPAAVRPSAATSRARTGIAPGRDQSRAPQGVELVETAVQAAGELAQIGFTLGARALRGALSRLPRP
jgi:hypothetical protein